MAFQTMKSFSPLATISIITLLLLLLSSSKVNSQSEEISFSFNSFLTEQRNLIFQAYARVSPSGRLELTRRLANGNPQPNSIGRALYSTPIRLWDRSSAVSEASFVTFFSFVVDAPNRHSLGEGLAFFIAPIYTVPRAGGGLLGLFPDRFTRPQNQIIAVEFDTHHNREWDIDDIPHIGINVNGIESIRAVGTGSFRNRTVATVLVTYDPNHKSLVASLVYPELRLSYIVSANVDVRATVPEWVRVGFTATTSAVNVQTHDILSWSFRSRLPAGDFNVLNLNTTSLHHDHMNNQLSSF